LIGGFPTHPHRSQTAGDAGDKERDVGLTSHGLKANSKLVCDVVPAIPAVEFGLPAYSVMVGTEDPWAVID
jgi:hypothetical protein